MSKWTPQNDEPALTLAAIRWYAMSLEKLATDLYITNREIYPDVKAVLSAAFKELGKLRGYCIPNEKTDDSSKPAQRWPAGQWADQVAAQKAATAETSEQPQRKMMNFSEEDGCGPGYVECNGVCLPDCDRIAEY